MENATEKEPGAASVWQQKQKVHLLANNDRNLPALVVNFRRSVGRAAAGGAETADGLAARAGGQAQQDRDSSPFDASPAARRTARSATTGSCATSAACRRCGFSKRTASSRNEFGSASRPRTSRSRRDSKSAWQDENNCVEVFLLTEVVDIVPGTVPTTAAPAASQSRTTPAASH